MRLGAFSPRPKRPKLFLVRRIMGDSMAPTLQPGVIVFGVRPSRVRPGDVVIVRHDNIDKIKRVKEVQENKVFLIGDNSSQSTDSRDFGWLEVGAVLARVVWPKRVRS